MPDNKVAIVPYTDKPPENNLMHGDMPQVMANIPQSVARMEAERRFEQAKEDAEETERFHDEVRARALEILGNGLTHISDRLDGYETRKQERADQQRRDEEEAEAAAVERMLAALPDPEDPQALSDDGELTAVHKPPDTEKYDPEHRNEAISGAMPKELEEGAPPEIGEFGAPLPPPSPYRDPASLP